MRFIIICCISFLNSAVADFYAGGAVGNTSINTKTKKKLQVNGSVAESAGLSKNYSFTGMIYAGYDKNIADRYSCGVYLSTNMVNASAKSSGLGAAVLENTQIIKPKWEHEAGVKLGIQGKEIIPFGIVGYSLGRFNLISNTNNLSNPTKASRRSLHGYHFGFGVDFKYAANCMVGVVYKKAIYNKSTILHDGVGSFSFKPVTDKLFISLKYLF